MEVEDLRASLNQEAGLRALSQVLRDGMKMALTGLEIGNKKFGPFLSLDGTRRELNRIIPLAGTYGPFVWNSLRKLLFIVVVIVIALSA